MSKIIKNVSGKQKKQIDAAVKKARPNGNGKIPVTAQQSIPFNQMFKDGILNVTLTANDWDSVIKPKLEAAGVYDMYLLLLETKGNKPDLF